MIQCEHTDNMSAMCLPWLGRALAIHFTWYVSSFEVLPTPLPSVFFFLIIRPPPTPPLFPSTTLFRSGRGGGRPRGRVPQRDPIPGTPPPRPARKVDDHQAPAVIALDGVPEHAVERERYVAPDHGDQ